MSKYFKPHGCVVDYVELQFSLGEVKLPSTKAWAENSDPSWENMEVIINKACRASIVNGEFN